MPLFKKTTLIFLLTMFLLVSLFFPNNNVQAQWIVTDPGTGGLLVWQTVKNIAGKLIEEAWEHGGAIAYKNTVNFYLGQMAQQSAEYLATGGKGQKPLFLDKPGEYLRGVADNFAGEYIDKASKDIFGRSLCDPIDPNITFQLLISLDQKEMSVQQMGKCSASQVLARLQAMTWKDMVQFEAKLSDGPPAKYKSDIKIIIASDAVLNKARLEGVHAAARCHEDGYYTIESDALGELCCTRYCETGNPGPYVNMGVGKLLDIANDLIVSQDDFEIITTAWKSFEEGKFSERVGILEKGIEEAAKEINFLTNNTENCSNADGFWKRWECSKTEEKKQKYENTLIKIKEKIEAFKINKDIAIADLIEIENDLILIKGVVSEYAGDYNNPDIANKLAFWEEYTKSCQRKNLDDFYSEPACRVIDYFVHGSWAQKLTEQGRYSDTIIYTKRIDIYVKQLVEWRSILKDMVEKTKKAYIDMGQVPDLAPLEDLNRMYNPEASDIGISYGLKSDLFKKQQEQIEKSKFAQTLQGRISDVKTKISGVAKTPSTLVDESSRAAVKGSDPASFMQYTGVAVADAIGIFTNTLMSKLLTQIFEKGFNKEIDPSQVDLTRPDDVVSTSTGFSSDLKIASIDETKEEVNMYNEFAVCPGEGYATPTHCLIQDASFRRAIEQGLTLKQAVDGGYLNGEASIGVSGDTESQLSYPVIKKLRRFRIFPLGLEIAARKIFYQEEDDTGVSRDVTKSLNQLFKHFYNSDSDYNHLVDPNWVLKSPAYQCSAKGYSSIPVKGIASRQEMCVDLKGCVHEDEQGKCDTWGYCTREKNIWNLEGNVCDAQYAGCRRYQRVEDGKEFFYLADTLNLEGCDYSGSGGCKWYCKNQDQITEEWNCLNPGHVFTLDTGAADFLPDEDLENVIFFNSNIQECSSKNEGCHEYISIAPNTGTNLVVNGSFNKDEDADNFPDEWTDGGGTSAISFLQEAINIKASDNNDHWVQQVIEDVPALADEFVLSGKIRLTDYHSGTIGLKLAIYYTGTPTTFDSNSEEINTNVLDAEQHIFVHLRPDPNKTIDYVIVYGPWSDGLDGEFYGDNIQLELGSNASSYKDYGTKNKEYFKTAPDYLESRTEWESCTDDDLANDLEICDKYVIECLPEEVGCELYSPFNTDPKVPGIVKEQDKCSSNCLGYETFQETLSNFDSESRWVNLIPSIAETCSFPGCEEFTNLETENREYYSYLRQCVKTNDEDKAIIDSDGTPISPNPGLCEHYFTWVGSGTSGYELKQYYLKKGADDGPIKISDDADQWGECDIDNLNNPHCKQFYNTDGTIYYRLYKNTITCSEDCSPYRKTIPVEYSNINDETDCENIGGVWDESLDARCQRTDFRAISSQGEVCDKSNVGCREYKGPTSGNVEKVFTDDFESGTTEPWVGGGTLPDGESVNFPGFSLKAIAASISRPVNDLVYENRTYFVSFWIKGTTSVTVQFTPSETGDIFSQEELNSGEWQEVKSSSFYFNAKPSDEEKLIITGDGGDFYIDNIILKQVQDNPYLIKDSWQTPCECDTQGSHVFYSTGALGCDVEDYAEDTMVGCQVYQNREGQNRYLKSFTRLCSESVVGCEALIDTQNFSKPSGDTFNDGLESEGDLDNVIVPSHKLVYFINDSNKKCSSQEAGCQKFGLPELDINQNAKQGMYKSVYLKNKPDLYKGLPTLCLQQNLGCEEYENEKSFKSPGEKVCEYRENVNIGDETRTGWFKRDTDEPCYALYETNRIYDIYSNDKPDYRGWVGECERVQSGCTEFIDPLAANLAVNTGFELYDTDGVPNGYIRNSGIPPANEGDIGISTIETGGQNDGEVSYKVHVPIAGGYYGLKHDTGIKVLPNTQYEVSAYIKTETLSGNVSIGMHCHDIDHSTIAYDHDSDAGTPLKNVSNVHFGTDELNLDTWGTWDSGERYIAASDQDWTKVWGKFTTFSDTDHCHMILMFAKAATGTAYFDTIRFAQIDSKDASYFYINNDSLDKSSCNGQVGLKDGCIFLNDTSDQSLIYNSVVNYANSFANNDLLINPERDIKDGDANIIVKAKRDRVCGEWLTCTGTRYIWDPILEKWRETCEFIGRCDKLIGTGQESTCGHYVIYSNPKVLTEDKYKSRDISWSGMDYSGYSIYGLYPVEVLFPEEYEENIYKLTYKEVGSSPLDKGVDGQGNKLEKTCKVFPEEGSPFKRELELDGDGNIYNENYKNVNICSETGIGEFADCQCTYKKVSYVGEDRYYYKNSQSIPPGICISVGGAHEIGETCLNNQGCGAPGIPSLDPGVCVKKTKSVSAIGLRGFCLEKDESSPDENYCLTWWLGSGIGDPDIYMNDLSAAFAPSPSHTWYCQDTLEDGPQWEDVTGSHCDNGVGGGDRSCRCENETYNITSLPEISMKEVEKIEVRIGVDDNGGVCGWGNLHAKGYHDLTETGDNQRWIANEEDDSSGNNDFDCDCEKGGACIKIKACFGSDCENNHPDDLLHHFAVKQIDCSYGDASARFAEADIYLKDGCNFMIKIPQENNGIIEGAYTNELWEESTSYVTGGGINGCEAYGAYSLSTVDRLVVPDYVADVSIIECDEYPTEHDEAGLKDLFAKVNQRERFHYTGNVDEGTCENVLAGYCNNHTTEPCFINDDCLGVSVSYGPCGPQDTCAGDDREDCQLDIDCTNYNIGGPCGSQDTCTQDGTICIWDSDCIDRDSCEYVTPGACNNGGEPCFNNDDCIFDADGMIYSPIVGGGWDERESASSADNAPTIASVDMSTCDQNDICDTAGLDKVTINGMNDMIIEKEKSYPVSLKFFAWANENQMPIRDITIDWIGDKPENVKKIEYDVVLKNYKPCSAEPCVCGNSPLSFGDSAGGCITKYLNFTYIYNCEGENSPGWNAHGCSNMCCFKPTVYIRDNWGWCDGGGSGFYAEEDEECIDLVGSGTSYNQLIKITP